MGKALCAHTPRGRLACCVTNFLLFSVLRRFLARSREQLSELLPLFLSCGILTILYFDSPVARQFLLDITLNVVGHLLSARGPRRTF